MDVSKAIDKCNGETGRLLKFTEWMRTTGLAARQINKITETNMGSHYLTAVSQPAIPTPALWALLRPHCGDVPEWVDQLVQRIEAEREVVGQGHRVRRESTVQIAGCSDGVFPITAPATPEAQQWAGWGTALKPALEPITMARKPLEGTVAANVLAHGTGGINVDGCMVATTDSLQTLDGSFSFAGSGGANETGKKIAMRDSGLGRWPANLIHDGSDEVVGLFPQRDGAVSNGRKGTTGSNGIYIGGWGAVTQKPGRADTGSAARFFYTAKASKKDRGDGNTHPTVKPTDLMRYLCRLVTPPGGIVLDPFMGSGSTGKAAMLEGFEFIGIEREAADHAIAESRIGRAAAAGYQPSLLP
jgi:hypothetical protein